MVLRWDALLAHHLARELDARLRGTRLRALRLDARLRDLTLLFRDETLRWRLHPTRGWLDFHPPQDPGPGDRPLPYRVVSVDAPPDERLVVLRLAHARRRGAEAAVVVQLQGNQWNAFFVEGAHHRIRHVLRSDRGVQKLAVGANWTPPASPRLGIEGDPPEDVWGRVALASPHLERRRALIGSIAWTSSLNADAILGPEGSSPEDLSRRWRAVARPDVPPDPVVLRLPSGPQPYPVPLPDVGSDPATSLIDALAASAALADRVEPPLPTPLLEALEEALEQARGRLFRLERELTSLPDADAARRVGDLLLARFHEVPGGASEAELEGFDGAPVRVALDPALSVQDNARRYYDRAARVARARVRLPELRDEARRDLSRLEEAWKAAAEGGHDPDAILDALPAAVRRTLLRPERGARRERVGPAPLPYRIYRSSGGLEIRVGRGARHNDALTFKHAAPGDVWLHARHAAGAHVILRWPGPGSPPGRDLEEAAVLAAYHSRARTSGKVPVDWTFRKYVRKPRGAAPGAVAPQRVKTLFVAPDPDRVAALESGE